MMSATANIFEHCCGSLNDCLFQMPLICGNSCFLVFFSEILPFEIQPLDLEDDDRNLFRLFFLFVAL